MEPKTLLFFNATITVIISISTDYWILVSYDETTAPPENCSISKPSKEYMILECDTNETALLLEQWSSTIRQCNDLTERHRNAIRRRNLIYDGQCETLLKTSPWRFDGANSALDNLGFVCILGTLLCFVFTMINGRREDTNPSGTAIAMLVAGILLLAALVATAANIYLIRIQTPKRRIDALVNGERIAKTIVTVSR
ncbi:hypothetical protein QR680_013540 [Steinernema hermaphroditum]|uniref:Uncharacterized protein n=1 Tax=Steinernema hermaphroditum TaxID=289476 RepID=A0AA39I5W0_9BILA|nr:hypothetical protein QR680_013540 [Steinernema hermaphroditum]